MRHGDMVRECYETWGHGERVLLLAAPNSFMSDMTAYNSPNSASASTESLRICYIIYDTIKRLRKKTVQGKSVK